jgi:hypothetical protein
MNDLERDLRELLQRRADEGWAQPEAPVRVVRRVRRRQAATAMVAGVAAALVGLASFAGVRAVLDPNDGATPAAPTTTGTLNGITIEYPEGWFLADPQTFVEAQFGQDALLILANRAPSSAEALGCPGMAVDRPEPVVIPDVLMTVEGRPTQIRVDSWPASLDPIEVENDFDRSCFPGWDFLSARWTVSGRSYEGVVGIAPTATTVDREAVLSAFASMSFAQPTVDPTLGTILAEGTAGGEDWQLSAGRQGTGVSLELSWEGGAAGFGSAAGSPPLDLEVASQILGSGVSAEQVVFGVVTSGAAEVSIAVSPDGQALPATQARIVDIPDDIARDVNAFVGVVPVGDGTVRAYDGQRNLLDEAPVLGGSPSGDEMPTATLPPVEEGEPPVEPVAPVHGGRYWGAYLWLGTAEDAEQVGFETADWLRERGVPYSAGDLGCDDPVDGSIGDPGENWGVAVYFDDEADANLFVEWYLEARFPGADHVPIPIIEVRTYCLD